MLWIPHSHIPIMFNLHSIYVCEKKNSHNEHWCIAAVGSSHTTHNSRTIIFLADNNCTLTVFANAVHTHELPTAFLQVRMLPFGGVWLRTLLLLCSHHCSYTHNERIEGHWCDIIYIGVRSVSWHFQRIRNFIVQLVLFVPSVYQPYTQICIPILKR